MLRCTILIRYAPLEERLPCFAQNILYALPLFFLPYFRGLPRSYHPLAMVMLLMDDLEEYCGRFGAADEKSGIFLLFSDI